jgi:hypothetical protein
MPKLPSRWKYSGKDGKQSSVSNTGYQKIKENPGKPPNTLYQETSMK